MRRREVLGVEAVVRREIKRLEMIRWDMLGVFGVCRLVEVN